MFGKNKKPAWKALLKESAPVQLPAAHDALTARLIELAGFDAYQVGGFALTGARHAFPDIDLCQFREQCDAVREIIAASALPVLVDADDGYGDVKNVTRTVQEYESMGVSAMFIEDQRAPKRCGHMAKKEVVPTEVMEGKIRAAVEARRNSDTFLVARTDALEPHGLDEALRRAEHYIQAGADGIYVEAPRNLKELEKIGSAFKGTPQMTNMFEGDDRTPWLKPKELKNLGFSMILYPTSVLLRVTTAIQKALKDLKAGKKATAEEGANLAEFEEIVSMAKWAAIEKRHPEALGGNI